MKRREPRSDASGCVNTNVASSTADSSSSNSTAVHFAALHFAAFCPTCNCNSSSSNYDELHSAALEFTELCQNYSLSVNSSSSVSSDYGALHSASLHSASLRFAALHFTALDANYSISSALASHLSNSSATISGFLNGSSDFAAVHFAALHFAAFFPNSNNVSSLLHSAALQFTGLCQTYSLPINSSSSTSSDYGALHSSTLHSAALRFAALHFTELDDSIALALSSRLSNSSASISGASDTRSKVVQPPSQTGAASVS